MNRSAARGCSRRQPQPQPNRGFLVLMLGPLALVVAGILHSAWGSKGPAIVPEPTSLQDQARTSDAVVVAPPPAANYEAAAAAPQPVPLAEADDGGEDPAASPNSIPPAELLARLQVMSSANDLGSEDGLSLVRQWASLEPAAAAAWAMGQTGDDPSHSAVLEQIALGWAETNLAGALDWVASLPEGQSKAQAALSVAYEASRSEPTKAIELARTLAPSPERDDLLAHAASQWAAIDPVQAAGWSTQVPDAALRQRLLAAVAVGSAERDGAAAATLAGTALAAGPEQDRAAVAIVQRWAQAAPQAAADWVSQFPDSPARVQAAAALHAMADRDAGSIGAP